VLVLDEHEQVKILSHRTWRGVWRAVTLWRDGMHGLSAHDLMQYLVQLATAAQQNAPASASVLLPRSQDVAAASQILPEGPRGR
jgi:hypothetical protein